MRKINTKIIVENVQICVKSKYEIKNFIKEINIDFALKLTWVRKNPVKRRIDEFQEIIKKGNLPMIVNQVDQNVLIIWSSKSQNKLTRISYDKIDKIEIIV